MSKQLTINLLNLSPRLLVTIPGMEFGFAQISAGRKLAVLITPDSQLITEVRGETSKYGDCTPILCPLHTHKANSLRNRLPWLKSQLLRVKSSAGKGDRIGIATPGHVQAMRRFKGKITPSFAQQSIREMKRTAHNPQQVMDDATRSIFEKGWHDGVGAESDHLKIFQDIHVV
jgi:hypothetical protein